MGAMQQQLNPQQMAAQMAAFQRENQRLDMVGEMVGDALEDALDDEAAEEETGELVNQVCCACIWKVSVCVCHVCFAWACVLGLLWKMVGGA